MKLYEILRVSDIPVDDHRDDNILWGIAQRLSVGRQRAADIEYVQTHYPEFVLNSPTKIYRGITVTTKQLEDAGVKNKDQFEQFILSFKSNRQVSWSTSRAGIDYYFSHNLSSNRVYPTTRELRKSLSVFILLSQVSVGIDLSAMVNYLDDLTEQPTFGRWEIKRTENLQYAQEILAPVDPSSLKIVSVQVPYHSQDGTMKVAHLTPNDVSTIYDIQRQVKKNRYKGTWDGPHHSTKQYDTSSIPYDDPSATAPILKVSVPWFGKEYIVQYRGNRVLSCTCDEAKSQTCVHMFNVHQALQSKKVSNAIIKNRPSKPTV